MPGSKLSTGRSRRGGVWSISTTLAGTVTYRENAQDPNDDARDGTVVTLTNAKFALKSLVP